MIENDVPNWLKEREQVGLLLNTDASGSTSSRNRRESKVGKQTGRTTEIQRLIGRSLDLLLIYIP